MKSNWRVYYSIISPLIFFYATKSQSKNAREYQQVSRNYRDEEFTGKPSPGEIGQKRKKVQDDLKKIKVAQEKKALQLPYLDSILNGKERRAKLFGMNW